MLLYRALNTAWRLSRVIVQSIKHGLVPVSCKKIESKLFLKLTRDTLNNCRCFLERGHLDYNGFFFTKLLQQTSALESVFPFTVCINETLCITCKTTILNIPTFLLSIGIIIVDTLRRRYSQYALKRPTQNTGGRQ